ncbi:MAG: hypothetical protein K9L59_18600, partial [Desulfobacterales bacterium]|nr:hypothetical protein [Desulfobacterales bacterium]
GGGAAANKYAKADLFRQLEGLIRPFLRCLGLRSSSYDPTRRRGTMGFPEGVQQPVFGEVSHKPRRWPASVQIDQK